jgi:hypothetical protein
VTILASPVGHPTLKLKDIAPSVSAAFSPNLHRWMKAHGHAYTNGGVAQTVYRVIPNSRLSKDYGDGTLLIGCAYNQYEGDTDFSGSLLKAVLCNGAKATSYCYAGAMRSLEVVSGFWDDYLKVGRCAIDPSHEDHYLGGDRYSVAGDIRTCLWCGEKHQKIMTPRTVFDESWTTL